MLTIYFDFLASVEKIEVIPSYTHPVCDAKSAPNQKLGEHCTVGVVLYVGVGPRPEFSDRYAI